MKTERTEFDWCFNEKAKEVGYWYYVNDFVTNVTKIQNIYSCNCGKYDVKIEFSNNRKEEMDDIECSCSYHENEDNYCPHIYALICYIFKVDKLESGYNDKLLEKYKFFNVERIKKEFDKGNIDMIDLDFLGYKYEDLFPDRNNNPLFESLDAYIESMPMEVLEEARRQTILDGDSTRILDKAINNKLETQKRMEEEEKAERKKLIFSGLISGLFSGVNKASKKDLNNLVENDYEPYQFEEEELEEDDYYYEDED